MPSAPGANGIAPLVRNSIDAHIGCSLIWPICLAVSETRYPFLIFDPDAMRPIRARMSLVRTSNARRHWPRMVRGRPGATASTMDEESIEYVSRLASRRIFRPPAWDRPAWDDASDGADQSAGLDAALEKDQKNHDGFEHSST